MVSDFVADCRRIDEWGKEWGAMLLEFALEHPGQQLGVDFTLEDLPYLAVDLPSRRKACVHPAAQDSSLAGDLLAR
jgi:hypothetical protein